MPQCVAKKDRSSFTVTQNSIYDTKRHSYTNVFVHLPILFEFIPFF